ncbi:MAG: zinc ABC transporter substrate-binding protein [Hyphomicrobium sp. 32-62-53]|nr:MAG: zinc ABC transporter substrate-binding protein [Hyphomicrobium sp. 12-62-95]OYY00501.1 MAG: zinc ABC transporter substrate-binding protein [Hyphomicrobium sp. 32-62-53]
MWHKLDVILSTGKFGTQEGKRLALAQSGFRSEIRSLFKSLAGSFGRAAAIGLASALVAVPGTARAEELNVVATIKSIHSLVAQVMGDVGAPRLLVGGAASPHTYSMKPSDARALNAARVVFRVSEEIEPFTRKIVASLPKSVSVVTLADAPGLKLLDKRTGDTFEAHDHGDHGHHDHGHKDHAHKDHGHADHDGGTVRDGHVWLDPENAAAMVREIARALSEAAPEHTATFKDNADKAIVGIDVLAKEIEAELAAVKGKSFVVFHDAYQYFEQRFGLTAAGAITVSPEVQPSAKRLSEIRGQIKALGVACVFAEPQFKSKLVATVIEGTGAKAGTLDPEGAAVEPGDGAYAALLRNLAQGLTSCLGT